MGDVQILSDDDHPAVQADEDEITSGAPHPMTKAEQSQHCTNPDLASATAAWVPIDMRTVPRTWEEEMTMSVQSNRELAIRYVDEVIGEGNLALIDELVHPGAQDLSGPWPPGPRGFREHIAGFRGAFEPEVAIERVIADEEYAAVYWRGQGRHVGAAFGIEPTDRPVENSFISTLQFRDGMIVAYEVMVDMLSFLVQVGTLGPWASEFPG